MYAINEHGFRVIQDVTQDHAVVAQKLAAWVPNMQAVAQAQADDKRNKQQFDTVRNLVDLNSVNGNFIQVPEGIDSIDPQLRTMGQNPLRDILPSLTALARHFAAVPGHKCMAWISGDSALADWDDRRVRTDKNATTQDYAASARARSPQRSSHCAIHRRCFPGERRRR